jgi:unsaturated rhamnogalacturonyl hydrolase
MNISKHALGVALLAAAGLLSTGCATSQKAGSGVASQPKPAEVLALMTTVNDHWQAGHPAQVRSFWDNAAYQTGNMAAFAVTKNDKYRQYAEDWAVFNNWKGATSDDRATWKYKYGETPDHVLFGDWQICFQTYIDLYKIKPEPVRIARAREVMEYEMSTPQCR